MSVGQSPDFSLTDELKFVLNPFQVPCHIFRPGVLGHKLPRVREFCTGSFHEIIVIAAYQESI